MEHEPYHRRESYAAPDDGEDEKRELITNLVT